jgi:hypothetical protein
MDVPVTTVVLDPPSATPPAVFSAGEVQRGMLTVRVRVFNFKPIGKVSIEQMVVSWTVDTRSPDG